MKQQEKIFLKKIQELLQDKYETRMVEDEGLNFILPHMGLNRGSVKAELIFYDEDCEIEGKESGVLQFYITVCTYNEKEEAELAVRLLELNGRSLLGHFNMYKPLRHVYYRYSLPIPDLEDESALETIFVVLSKLSSNLDYLYSYIIMISNQVSSITLNEYEGEMENLKKVLEIDPDFLDKMNEDET